MLLSWLNLEAQDSDSEFREGPAVKGMEYFPVRNGSGFTASQSVSVMNNI